MARNSSGKSEGESGSSSTSRSSKADSRPSPGKMKRTAFRLNRSLTINARHVEAGEVVAVLEHPEKFPAERIAALIQSGQAVDAEDAKAG